MYACMDWMLHHNLHIRTDFIMYLALVYLWHTHSHANNNYARTRQRLHNAHLSPIMLPLCLMLFSIYYAGIIGAGLTHSKLCGANYKLYNYVPKYSNETVNTLLMTALLEFIFLLIPTAYLCIRMPTYNYINGLNLFNTCWYLAVGWIVLTHQWLSVFA